MGFDLDALRRAVDRHGRVARVVIAASRGSCPREAGAAMLVWGDGQAGTIGGGALELRAVAAARRQVEPTRLSRYALGPDLGQCCGGSVTLLSELFKAGRAMPLSGEVVARPVADATAMPLAVKRLLARVRGQGLRPEPQLIDGWMVEPVFRPVREIWVWGAGHVGRALVEVISTLPDLAITWVDTGPERFPEAVPDRVTVVPAADPRTLVRYAPITAEHLVLTYSHALDLDLCHRLLAHDFAFAGVIGSATKWARFRSRLAALGHAPERIARLTCPIGDPHLGKHPQAIAIGVAAALLRPVAGQSDRGEKRA